MKKLLIVFLLGGVVGCYNEGNNSIQGDTSRLFNLTIVKIDGCEYLKWRTQSGYYSITHKGNCHSSEHNPAEVKSDYLIGEGAYLRNGNTLMNIPAK